LTSTAMSSELKLTDFKVLVFDVYGTLAVSRNPYVSPQSSLFCRTGKQDYITH